MGSQLFLQSEEGKQKQKDMIDHSVKKLREVLPVETPITFNDTEITFMWKGSKIVLFPYTGWHTGKTIVDGRGLKNLLKQIKQ